MKGNRQQQEAPLPRRAQRVRRAYSRCTLLHLSGDNQQINS